MDDIYNFLMFDLYQITEEFDSPHQAAHEACILFSVDSQGLPETFYNLYISKIDIAPEIMKNATAFFTGAGFLNVHCDCEASDKPYCDIAGISSNEFYDLGTRDLNAQTPRWKSMLAQITQLREALT